jgi:hypothetical protein
MTWYDICIHKRLVFQKNALPPCRKRTRELFFASSETKKRFDRQRGWIGDKPMHSFQVDALPKLVRQIIGVRVSRYSGP